MKGPVGAEAVPCAACIAAGRRILAQAAEVSAIVLKAWRRVIISILRWVRFTASCYGMPNTLYFARPLRKPKTRKACDLLEASVVTCGARAKRLLLHALSIPRELRLEPRVAEERATPGKSPNVYQP